MATASGASSNDYSHESVIMFTPMLDVSQGPPRATFRDWTNDRDLASLGTNAGAPRLPFQTWHHFKEAFAPELVKRAATASNITVRRCIDPFGGSGTTGIACQFLGIHPTIVEINPYLADLIEAKLFSYDSIDTLNHSLESVLESCDNDSSSEIQIRFGSTPRTLVEPGHNGRWLFDKPVANRILALRHAFRHLDEDIRRLFNVLLGGILIEVSNVIVSGKGRRYRRRWKDNRVPATKVDMLFTTLVERAIDDIHRFSLRPVTSYEVLQRDSRTALRDIDACELAVFSPPYPNSFDYTDVYNIELWALGYLDSREANSSLRAATLTSHVQINRDFAAAPTGSSALATVLEDLIDRKERLWNHKIPAMVGAYFSDLLDVLRQLRHIVVPGGSAWIVLGDSRYAGVHIPTATVVAELIKGRGWSVQNTEPFRSMRTSPQQGGDKLLSEELLVLRNER